MRPTPKGWPRLSSAVFYEEPGAAIGWLCRAFGFEVRLKIEGEGGTIAHSELTYGEAVVMVGQAGGRSGRPAPVPSKSPRTLGGAVTQALSLYVDDADGHCARARAAGARIVEEPHTEDYGPQYWSDRSYRAVDLEGHQWWFTERVRG
jgi:uncharacterized glyoxalase superfamily protein PhnB